VGITRAQKKLTLTYCRRRKKMGQIKPVFPSRFLSDCNKALYNLFEHGSRPVTDADREVMVSEFLKKLSQPPTGG
jgi:hypothetical protein